eukprot:m.70666 g.70666  ORF g.70666 m.70666 type:complete len:529 (+) comp11674_c1_seq1:99-1685(+)
MVVLALALATTLFFTVAVWMGMFLIPLLVLLCVPGVVLVGLIMASKKRKEILSDIKTKQHTRHTQQQQQQSQSQKKAHKENEEGAEEQKETKHDHPSGGKIIGFFHPFCNAGGGGERVLWTAINAVHNEFPSNHCVVYTGDKGVTEEDILQNAQSRFGIRLDGSRITFVFLQLRTLVEAHHYPHFTMLLQSIGSLILGFEALLLHQPDVLIDTMGYAFILPMFRLLSGNRIKVAAYVHYPTISTDMVEKVQRNEADFNNTSAITRSAVLSNLKLIYYRLFALVYGLAGSSAQVVMANSSWTARHIRTLWKFSSTPCNIVYPPCDMNALASLPLDGRKHVIVSVAQFRPEKNHKLQLDALHQYTTTYNDKEIKLIMVGGCRNEGDRKRVEELRSHALHLGLTEGVEFEIKVNVSYEELQEHLRNALIGIHTMKDEHFGIGVVEFLAAGPIAIANNSAGPKEDIVCDYHGSRTGYLASTAEEYAACIHEVVANTSEGRKKMQLNARESSMRFSEEHFSSAFLAAVASLLN